MSESRKNESKDNRTIIDDLAAKFSQALIKQNQSYNEIVASEMKGLVALREPDLFFTRQYSAAAAGSFPVFTAKDNCRLQWASIQTQTAAVIQLALVHGNVSTIILSGYGGTTVWHSRHYGKGGIKLVPGDTLNIITTSSQATHTMANLACGKPVRIVTE